MNSSKTIISPQGIVVARPNFDKNFVLIWATITTNLKGNNFVRREIRPYQGQKGSDNYSFLLKKKRIVFLFGVVIYQIEITFVVFITINRQTNIFSYFNNEFVLEQSYKILYPSFFRRMTILPIGTPVD